MSKWQEGKATKTTTMSLNWIKVNCDTNFVDKGKASTLKFLIKLEKFNTINVIYKINLKKAKFSKNSFKKPWKGDF